MYQREDVQSLLHKVRLFCIRYDCFSALCVGKTCSLFYIKYDYCSALYVKGKMCGLFFVRGSGDAVCWCWLGTCGLGTCRPGLLWVRPLISLGTCRLGFLWVWVLINLGTCWPGFSL